ncbi:MAG: anti-sigma factor [Betaproteobacteria bacterium]|nr:anti-sigma factor [Betaproteobacteria bacterium]
MNCTHARQLLDAYLDNEVDAATRLAMAEHLAVCPTCATQRAGREALVQRIRADAPRYPAPALLARRISHAANPVPQPAGRGVRGPNWAQAAAAAAVIAVGSAALGYHLGRAPSAPLPYEAVVKSHVASLAPGARLLDVAATDRHTVKPWLQGRVDFAPAVQNLAAQGYPLLGARLDRVGGHDGAAIVYRVRNHVINLFVWRAEDGTEATPPAVARARGYGVTTWAEGGLRYTAISDVELGDLDTFSRLVRESPR